MLCENVFVDYQLKDEENSDSVTEDNPVQRLPGIFQQLYLQWQKCIHTEGMYTFITLSINHVCYGRQPPNFLILLV